MIEPVRPTPENPDPLANVVTPTSKRKEGGMRETDTEPTEPTPEPAPDDGDDDSSE